MLTTATNAPRHETPNATMRTLAAPSLGASQLAVWEVFMGDGQRGPEHRVDREQVWTVLEGQLRVQVAGRAFVARAGDTLCVPPDLPRQVTAAADTRALVASPVGPTVTTAGGGSRPLPWAA